ncbi:MAG: hypothetical protein IKO92_01740, partial [Clostridia bacterium]|nr:hypothetical protein [Clostridia bacterium]
AVISKFETVDSGFMEWNRRRVPASPPRGLTWCVLDVKGAGGAGHPRYPEFAFHRRFLPIVRFFSIVSFPAGKSKTAEQKKRRTALAFFG